MPSLSHLRATLAEPRPIHRAFLFAGGLLLLFLVVQLVPSSGSDTLPRTSGPPPAAESMAGDASTSGVEAARSHRGGYRLFSAGNLIAFALLAGGGAYALHLRKRAGGVGDAPALFEPVGQMQLAQGQQLRLVRCGGEVLLLGVTSGQITLLRRYADDAFDDVPPSAPTPGFADLLRAHAAGSHA